MRRLVLAWTLLLGALALAACGSVEVRPVAGSGWKLDTHSTPPEPIRAVLAQAPDCCASLRELPWQDLAPGRPVDVTLDAQSPAHRFESGKSFFAAYRLAPLPRPALIEVESLRSAEPGSVLQNALPDTRQTLLQPTLVLLDASFREVRRIDALQPRDACATNRFEPAFKASLLLSEPPADAAYLVVLTTDESLARDGQRVCGVVRHGMSPVGELQLHARTLPIDDGPLRLALPVHWYPDTRRQEDVGFWQFMGAQTRWLVLGDTALYILRPQATGFVPLHSIPYAQVVRTSPVEPRGQSLRALSLTALDPSPTPTTALRQHTFETTGSAGDGAAGLDQVAAFLTARLGPARATLTVVWRVLPDAPALEVARTSRVGEAALAGGVITAMPCGLCQTGACPPEVLLPCAGLFGVGALLGGVGGALADVFSGPAPDAAARARLADAAPRETAMAPQPLEQCLRTAIERAPGTPWRDAGLSAVSVVAPDGTTTGAYRAEVALQRLALVPATSAAPSPDAGVWQLRIEARLRFIEQATGKATNRRVVWTSAAFPASAWAQKDASVWPQASASACEQLPGQLIEAARQAWQAD